MSVLETRHLGLMTKIDVDDKSFPTEIDRSILTLIAAGVTNKEIAKKRGRSPYTVKNQVEQIMHRLGAKNRAEAVAIAIRRRLI
ncbi:unnamed protein product [marine sediment metagenome]|uniref:HTH luxR-type domain-containing protein n=1 Tax=marine sediment metagenome TaxID=412755 RepID=X1T0L0_9ZZZZ